MRVKHWNSSCVRSRYTTASISWQRNRLVRTAVASSVTASIIASPFPRHASPTSRRRQRTSRFLSPPLHLHVFPLFTCFAALCIALSEERWVHQTGEQNKRFIANLWLRSHTTHTHAHIIRLSTHNLKSSSENKTKTNRMKLEE